MIGVKIEGFLVEGKRSRIIARLAQTEAHQAVDIGVLMGVSQGPQLGQRGLIVFGLDLGPYGREVRSVF